MSFRSGFKNQVQKLKDEYQQRQVHFADEALALRKQYDRISILRLLVFFGSAAIAIFFFSIHWMLATLFILLFLAGFYRLMLWHQKMLTDATHLERLAQINAEELAALNHRTEIFPSGTEFLETDHPYTLDLDVFGAYSFFQSACRATTVIGRQRLAEYLLQPAEIPEIIARQQAVSELRPLLDWRQHFQAFGNSVKDDPKHVLMLRQWLHDDFLVLGNRAFSIALVAIPAWTLAALLLWIFFVPWQLALLFLLPAGFILKNTKEKVDRIHLRTTHTAGMLASYARLLAHIESGNFSSKKLAELQTPLSANGHPASAHIRRLDYIIRQLNVRFNFFAIFLNLGALWDLQWLYRLEKWKAELRDSLPVWFETLREFEALSSFANTWFNNPDWTMPEVKTGARLEAVNLGHPLIHPSKRIGNDIGMPIRGHIKLITGSNMAGKSTFLRAVGLNVVLAQSGSPVCAEKMTLPPLRVFTSMRTRDDLHESTSSFYAELKRLKVIIEAVQQAQEPQSDQLPVFFLLDEILKGTNSVDRHTGARALIEQLIRLEGGGLIATHDLELGRLEADANDTIENLCMEVEVKNGELFFDYKIKKGVSQSFNATLLMRQMGIEVEVR